MNIRTITRVSLATLALLACLSISGCRANVGVGINVGVPIGDHGYMTIGSGGYGYGRYWH